MLPHNNLEDNLSTAIIDTLFDTPKEPDKEIAPRLVKPSVSFEILDGEEEQKTLTIPTHVKDIRPDKYNSKNLLDPKSQAEKDLYMKIYMEYVTNEGTQMDLAKKYGYTNVHVSRIIKWATFQMGEQDPSASLRGLLDSLKFRLKSIQVEINNTVDADTKVKLWNTQLKCEKLQAQLEKLVSTALIDASDKRQVHVQMNPDFNRRTGSELEGGGNGDDAKVIDATVEIEDEVQEPDFERRSGSELGEDDDE